MNFEIWCKFGSLPYRLTSLESMFAQTDTPCVLVETQEEKDILEGFSLVFGHEVDCRVIEQASSMNPWTYNRIILFYTFNPLERNQ